MAERVKIALASFGRGMAAFVRPFCLRDSMARRRSATPPQSIDRYFANVGGYLIAARNRFEREYMGVVDADK